ISSCADGGQITASTDFMSEIHRCLEAYPEADGSGSVGSEESLDNGRLAQTILKELRSLSNLGFKVEELGEKKLKGLENPEFVSALYPHSLAGRFDYHRAHEQKQSSQPSGTTASRASALELDPEDLWALCRVSLRLGMLCSVL